MRNAIVLLLFSSVILCAPASAQQSNTNSDTTQVQTPAPSKQPQHLTKPARRTVAFQSTMSAVKEFCGKHKDNASCKSDSTEYDAASKLVEKSPELQAYIETGVLPDKPITFSSLPVPYKSDVNVSSNSSMIETDSNVDTVSAAKARMDKACTYGLSMTARDITNTMADCAKATNDWEDAMKGESEVQNRAKAKGTYGSITGGEYLVSLTGTAGLPVTGTCSFAGKAESYDDVLPAQHVATGGRGVLCSFVKKYVQGTLKMQIIQNGAVRNEAETEASYGVVTLEVDW